MKFIYDDGGRAKAGFKGEAGDCVTRAIAIASQQPYIKVYNELKRVRENILSGDVRGGNRQRIEKGSIRDGTNPAVYKKYLIDHGWSWTPTMQIGSGCKVHMRANELPPGRLILAVSKHYTAVVDGICHDNHDPSRDGTRCVYGYWAKKEKQSGRKNKIGNCKNR